MIHLHHLYKTYSEKYHVLKDVNLNIHKSEIVFITGASGAGKSTLIRMIAGMDQPSSGSIAVNDFLINELSGSDLNNYRRTIGMVFQNFNLISSKTVFENVKLMLDIQTGSVTSSYAEKEKKIHSVLEKLNLSDKYNFFPEHLSGGEQQRAAIARAVIHNPAILIADEPTGNLDPDLATDVMNLFVDIANLGTTVLIASHDYQLVKKFANRHYHIQNSHLVQGVA
jgi:cell division transport system ATP-binding protein